MCVLWLFFSSCSLSTQFLNGGFRWAEIFSFMVVLCFLSKKSLPTSGHKAPCFLPEASWLCFKFRPTIESSWNNFLYIDYFSLLYVALTWLVSFFYLKDSHYFSLRGNGRRLSVTFTKPFTKHYCCLFIYVCSLFSGVSLESETNWVISLWFFVIAPHYTFRASKGLILKRNIQESHIFHSGK